MCGGTMPNTGHPTGRLIVGVFALPAIGLPLRTSCGERFTR
jgi:hypothetical protein